MKRLAVVAFTLLVLAATPADAARRLIASMSAPGGGPPVEQFTLVLQPNDDLENYLVRVDYDGDMSGRPFRVRAWVERSLDYDPATGDEFGATWVRLGTSRTEYLTDETQAKTRAMTERERAKGGWVRLVLEVSGGFPGDVLGVAEVWADRVDGNGQGGDRENEFDLEAHGRPRR